MAERFILDSSIWIDIQRGKKNVVDTVAKVINKDRVVLVDLIAAEVLRGVRTQKDYDLLKQYFSCFPTITSAWDEVSQLAFAVSRNGHNPPLADLYIAN